jgi:hypothetical protein
MRATAIALSSACVLSAVACERERPASPDAGVARLDGGRRDDGVVGPLFMAIDHRLRCDYAGGCPSTPAGIIATRDGEGGARLTCLAAAVGDAMRVDASGGYHRGSETPHAEGFRHGNEALTRLALRSATA